MASDISSGGNDAFDDEKEEGELSLEDVSSSEDTPSYRYPPRAFGQCPHCLSMQRCYNWCKSLTVNKYIPRREAPAYYVTKDAGAGGLQGKENRHLVYYKDPFVAVSFPAAPTIAANATTSKSITNNLYKNGVKLQEKNEDEESYSKVSSDTDMELVGLSNKTPKRHRRKKRRKKSPSLALALSLKESIHRHESPMLKDKIKHLPGEKKKSKSKRSKTELAKKRSKSPPRKTSPLRPNKILKKLPASAEDSAPVKQSTKGEVTKLLKKVRKLDAASSRNKEKSSSLKDKLSNIIKVSKDESPTVSIAGDVGEDESSSNSTEVKKEAAPDDSTKTEKETVSKAKEEKSLAPEEKKSDVDEEVVILEQVEKEKEEKEVVELEETKNESLDRFSPPPLSPPPADTQKLPKFCIDDNDEDLELRMKALRSAVMNKRRTRMQRNKRKQKGTSGKDQMPRIESPFTSTFIEDFPLLAEICNPESPSTGKKDIICSEDMELDSDMDLDLEDASPYSPSDDIVEQVVLGNNVSTLNQDSPVVKPTPMNLSLYSPSHPTETPANLKMHNKARNEDLDGSIFESRPYSPSDDTTYDPDLPGVFSSNQTALFSTTKGVAPLPPPPLPPMEPPPLPPMEPPPMPPMEPPPPPPHLDTLMPPPLSPIPPLNMFAPQSLMLGCQPNMINMFMDPIVSNVFTTIHQAINPLLLSAPASMFGFPAVTTTSSSGIDLRDNMNVNLTISKPSSIVEPISSVPDDIMDTDLDGSPLVPMEKDKHNSWPLLGEPLYLQNVLDKSLSDRNRIPPLMESLVPMPVLKNNKQLQKQPVRKPPQNNGLFRNANMIPVTLEDSSKMNSSLFQPIKLQSAPKKSINIHPADIFGSSAEDEVRQESKKLDDREDHRDTSSRAKRNRERKSVTPSPIDRRKRAKSIRPSESTSGRRASRFSRESSVSRTLRSQSRQKDDDKSKDSDKQAQNIDDDEDTLRAIVLASVAKNKKQRPVKKVQTLVCLKTSTESNDKASKTIPIVATSSVVAGNTDVKTYVTTAADATEKTANSLKRPATTPLPLADQPSTKVIRKVNTISASTKAVNNAKRFQNQLLQRRQKLLLAKSRFKIVNSNKLVTSDSPNATESAAKSSRFVIKLNEDTESESEEEPKKSPVKDRPAVTIPTTDFEKSLDQFLKNARMQHEMGVSKSPANTRECSPKVAPSVPTASTPSAQTEKEVTTAVSKVITSTETSTSKTLMQSSSPLNKVSPPASNKITTSSTTPLNITVTLITPPANKVATPSVSQLDKTVASPTSKTDALSTPTSKVTTKPFVSPLNKDAPLFIPLAHRTTASTVSPINKITTPLSSSMSKVATVAALPMNKSVTSVPTSSPALTSAVKTANVTASTAALTAANSNQDKTGVNPGKTLTNEKKSSILSDTPQAVKHLPAQQQEEYYLLKKQYFEKLISQKKTKDLGAPVTTANTASTTSTITTSTVTQPTNTQTVVNEPSKTPPVCTTPSASASPVLASSTPKATSKPGGTMPLVKSSESPILKNISEPKIVKSIANNVPTKSNASQPVSKLPVITFMQVIPSTSATSNQNQLKTNLNFGEDILKKLQAKTSMINSKINKLASNMNTAVPSSSVTPPPQGTTRKNSAAEEEANRKQALLLDKMHSVLNTQVQQISAAAEKVSSLRILTKDQINSKGLNSNQSNIKLENNATTSYHIKVESPFVIVKREPVENNVDMTIVKRENTDQTQVSTVIVKTEPSNTSVPIVKSEPPDTPDEVIASVKQEPIEPVETRVPVNTIKTEPSSVIESRPPNEPTQEEKNVQPSTVSNDVDNTKQTWDDFKRGVSDEVQSLTHLTTGEQKKLLTEVEEKLVTKRHTVLDDVAEMSTNLQQWEVERDMQNILTIEVGKLRQQLRIAEEKLQQQKDKLNSIQPKVSASHEKINNGRKECFRLSKICSGLGQQIVGPNYQVPTDGAELLNNRIKEVATHTQKLKNKKITPEATKKTNLKKTDRTKTNSNQIIKYINNSDNSEKVQPSVSNVNLNSDSVSAIRKEKSATITSQSESVSSVNNTSNIQTEPMDVSEEVSSLTVVNTIKSEDRLDATSVQKSDSNSQNKRKIINNEKSVNMTNENSIFITREIEKAVPKNSESNSTSCDNDMEVELIETNNNLNDSIEVIDISRSGESETNYIRNESSILNVTIGIDNEGPMETDSLENSLKIPKNKNLCTDRNISNNAVGKSFNKNGPKNASVREVSRIPKATDIKSSKTNSKNTNVSIDSFTSMKPLKPREKTDSKKLKADIVKANGKESKKLLTTKTVDVESENLSVSGNQPASSTSSLTTKDIERNSLTEFVESFENIAVGQSSKVNCSESHNNSNLPVIVEDQHSTLMEEIALLELASAVELPEVKSFGSTVEKTHVDQGQDKVGESQTPSLQKTPKLKKVVKPYESILKHFNIPRNNKPDGILCPFELMGTCNDEDCQFIHQSTSHCR